MKKFAIFFLCLVFCCSCGPKKGYAGPDLPPEQLALVMVGDSGSERKSFEGTVNGESFDTSGIHLLPGTYAIDVTGAFRSDPYDCSTSEDFDDYGYQSCMADHDKALRKNKSYVPDCDPSSYRSTTTECTQDVVRYSCAIQTLQTKANARYVVFGGEIGEKKAEITVRELLGPENKNGKETKQKCSYVGTSQEQITQ